MKKPSLCFRSFIHALGVLVYVSAIALLLSKGERIFGDGKSFIIPIFMLLLLIVSASITGLLVFGKPIMLFLDNKRKEAFSMLFSTLGWLALFIVLIAISVLLYLK